MPTAVEYIANILQNALKLDAIDSPAALRNFSALDDEIDPGFQALNAAATPRAFAAAEHQYGQVFQALGDGSVALGFDFQRDAVVFNVVNQLLGGADVFGGGSGSGRVADVFGGGSGSGRVADVFGGGSGSGRVADVFGGGSGSGRVADVFGGGSGSGRVADVFGGGGGSGRVADVFGGGSGSGRVADVFGGGSGSGTQADFGTLDRQLFATGGDLGALGVNLVGLSQVNSHRAFVAVEGRFDADLQKLGDDFTKLGKEAATFTGDIKAEVWGGGGGSGDQLRALYDGLSPISDEFAKIGADFAKLADIYGGGGGSGTNANDGGITAGDVFGGGGGSGFVALHSDLLTLDGSLQGLSAPLAGLLLPAVTPTPLT